MTDFKPIRAVLAVTVFLSVIVVLPFVLLHWGLGLDLIYSILGTCVWASLFMLILLFADLNNVPDEEDDQ